MKLVCLFLCTLILFVGLSGCTVPAGPPPAVDALGGLKITDLRDTSADLERADFLISIKVFHYLLDPNNLERLEPLYASTEGVVFGDKDAFDANGFGVTVVSHQEGGRIARTLEAAEAVRTGYGIISVPPGTTDILTSSPVYQMQEIRFVDLAGRQVSQPVYPGFLGWTLYAEDSAESDKILLKLSPAYWQTGTEDLRIRMGKEPINFNLLEFASFQTPLKPGDFLLLAPRRAPDDKSLSRVIFAGPGKRPRVKCFVLVCESAGL